MQISNLKKPARLARLVRLVNDERGLSTMEYAVLFVIIVVGALTLWSNIGGTLANNLEKGGGKFTNTMNDHNK